MKVTLSFLWFDIWVGVFIDRAKRTVYVCPFPCVVLKFEPRGSGEAS
ncbi:hypothetical protein [Microcella pacifica]|uniref:Uncharacterized protein n=1 Tax=Microcella pacifica TaxID=2591847 RepID=A0A9E5JMI4_9MICO|nr:hypothetical protein [Microcella pacifica]NHF62250.1 hypothetical protein [Microcella pacifica]